MKSSTYSKKDSKKDLKTIDRNLLILKLMEKKDLYGYEIIQLFRKRSDLTFHNNAGELYIILHTLEKEGLLKSYDGLNRFKQQKKHYTITKKGLISLEERKQEWAVYYVAEKNAEKKNATKKYR